MSTIVNSPLPYLSINNERLVFIDGTICANIQQCYNTLQLQLNIPDYFGNNLDALEEVLADLEWIVEDKIKIIIFNPTSLLKDDLSKKNDFIDILKCCPNQKITTIYLSDVL